MFQYKFDLAQVKLDLTSTLIELTHKLTNNLKLWIFGKWKILGKLQNWAATKSSAQCLLQI